MVQCGAAAALAAFAWTTVTLAAAASQELAVGTAAGGGVVHVLTQSDFDERVGDGSETPWLLKFYAPWCGHCKALEPTWQSLAARLEGDVNVGKVDCIANRWLSEQWDIAGFPSLKLVAEGKQYTYVGPRTADALEAFARGGWRRQPGSTLPKDLPLIERLFKSFGTYIVFIVGAIAVGLLLMMVCGPRPTEEQRARRKAFEEKMAEYEKRYAEAKAKANEPAPTEESQAKESAPQKEEAEGAAPEKAVPEKGPGEKKDD